MLLFQLYVNFRADMDALKAFAERNGRSSETRELSDIIDLKRESVREKCAFSINCY
jgi:hypothetical protein